MRRQSGVAVAAAMLALASCGSTEPPRTAVLSAPLPVAATPIEADAATPTPAAPMDDPLPAAPVHPGDVRPVVGVVDAADPVAASLAEGLAQQGDLLVVRTAADDILASDPPRLDVIVVGPATDADRVALLRSSGISVVAVRVEHAPVVDHAAVLLAVSGVLEERLDALVSSPASVEIGVPSCEDGTVRGRVDVVSTSLTDVRSDCRAVLDDRPRTAADAVSAGFVSVAEID